MTGVAHVVARAAADDPHTLAVLALSDALQARSADAPGAVFAATPPPLEAVRHLAELRATVPSLVVYHQQGAAPALVSRLVGNRLVDRGARLAVVFDGRLLDPLASRDLEALAAADAIGLATSDGGADRLAALGFPVVHRVPPVVARQRLAAVEGFAPTAHHLDVTLSGPLILTVDDAASAGDAARVVQAYAVLRTYLVRAGHLAIAIPETPDTDEAAVLTVCREVWGLRLTEAWAHRLVHPGERAALTRRAAVFVTAGTAAGDTRHALAAMAEGAVVVAAADASAAGVLGAGVLLLPADAGPALVAEAVAELLDDEARRARLAESAARRLDEFEPEIVAPVWRAALAA